MDDIVNVVGLGLHTYVAPIVSFRDGITGVITAAKIKHINCDNLRCIHQVTPGTEILTEGISKLKHQAHVCN